MRFKFVYHFQTGAEQTCLVWIIQNLRFLRTQLSHHVRIKEPFFHIPNLWCMPLLSKIIDSQTGPSSKSVSIHRWRQKNLNMLPQNMKQCKLGNRTIERTCFLLRSISINARKIWTYSFEQHCLLRAFYFVFGRIPWLLIDIAFHLGNGILVALLSTYSRNICELIFSERRTIVEWACELSSKRNETSKMRYNSNASFWCTCGKVNDELISTFE